MNDLTIPKIETLLPQAPEQKKTSSDTSGPSFDEFVTRSLGDVNRQMLAADQAIDDLATGRNKDIHNTMIAMKKAEISFELVMQIRNKLMTAYDEIRRMSI